MTITVECQGCNMSFTKKIDENTLNECAVETRSMGVERQFEIPINFKCPNCEKTLTKINVFEYPEGIYTAFAE